MIERPAITGDHRRLRQPGQAVRPGAGRRARRPHRRRLRRHGPRRDRAGQLPSATRLTTCTNSAAAPRPPTPAAPAGTASHRRCPHPLRLPRMPGWCALPVRGHGISIAKGQVTQQVNQVIPDVSGPGRRGSCESRVVVSPPVQLVSDT